MAHGEHGALPRGAAGTLCSRCGLPFTPEVLAAGHLVRLPSKCVWRHSQRLKASAPGAHVMKRVAVRHTCALCSHITSREYPSAQVAAAVLEARSRTAGQTPMDKAASSEPGPTRSMGRGGGSGSGGKPAAHPTKAPIASAGVHAAAKIAQLGHTFPLRLEPP